MKVKNVSVKVIGILGKDLMPDETMECNEFIVKNPAVETLVKMGFLKVDDSEEKAKAMKEEAMRQAREELQKEQEAANATSGSSDNESAADEPAADAPAAGKRRRTAKAPDPAAPAAE